MASGGTSRKSGKSKSQPEDEEIVYSGEALQIAASWLGITNAEAALAEEDNKQGIGGSIRPFKKHMGLGSSGPSKHQAGVAGLEHRLGRKIMMSSKARIGAGAGPYGGHSNTKHNAADKVYEKEEHSSDESEGRGAAVGKGKKRNAPASLRADLLASGGSKRRKKKNGGARGGG